MVDMNSRGKHAGQTLSTSEKQIRRGDDMSNRTSDAGQLRDWSGRQHSVMMDVVSKLRRIDRATLEWAGIDAADVEMQLLHDNHANDTQANTVYETDDDDDEPIPQTKRALSFHISETDKVKAFLTDRLERIQQVTVKKIAKAWIKAICPKKQARYPYQNAQRKRETGYQPEIPEWWPNLDSCDFKEPDHLKKTTRIPLVVHLIRLRPDPLKLQDWNNDTEKFPNEVHMIYGWTEFLRRHAPVTILDDIAPSNKAKANLRRELFEQFYEVARMEEEYEREGMDVQYQYEEDEKPLARKRTHRAVSESSSVDRDTNVRSRSPSSGGSCSGSKRVRLDKHKGVAAPEVKLARQTSNFAVVREDIPSDTGPRRGALVDSTPMDLEIKAEDDPTAVETNAAPPSRAVKMPRQRRRHHLPTTQQCLSEESKATARRQERRPEPVSWQPTMPDATTSFGSVASSHDIQPFDARQAHLVGHSMFPGNHDSVFTPFPYQPSQHALQIQQVSQVPQPIFETVPNTPAVSPTHQYYSDGMFQPFLQDFGAMSAALPQAAGVTQQQCYQYHSEPHAPSDVHPTVVYNEQAYAAQPLPLQHQAQLPHGLPPYPGHQSQMHYGDPSFDVSGYRYATGL